MKWNEYSQKNNYQSLSDESKRSLKIKFANSYIMPDLKKKGASEEEVAGVMQDFSARADEVITKPAGPTIDINNIGALKRDPSFDPAISNNAEEMAIKDEVARDEYQAALDSKKPLGLMKAAQSGALNSVLGMGAVYGTDEYKNPMSNFRYQPQTIPESLVAGGVSMAADLPVFALAAPSRAYKIASPLLSSIGQAMGAMGAIRMTKSYLGKKMEDAEIAWDDIWDVSKEGAKGLGEGAILGTLGEGPIGEIIKRSKLSEPAKQLGSKIYNALSPATETAALTAYQAGVDGHWDAGNVASNLLMTLALKGYGVAKKRYSKPTPKQHDSMAISELKGDSAKRLDNLLNGRIKLPPKEPTPTAANQRIKVLDRIKGNKDVKYLAKELAMPVKEVKDKLTNPDKVGEIGQRLMAKERGENPNINAEKIQKAYIKDEASQQGKAKLQGEFAEELARPDSEYKLNGENILPSRENAPIVDEFGSPITQYEVMPEPLNYKREAVAVPKDLQHPGRRAAADTIIRNMEGLSPGELLKLVTERDYGAIENQISKMSEQNIYGMRTHEQKMAVMKNVIEKLEYQHDPAKIEKIAERQKRVERSETPEIMDYRDEYFDQMAKVEKEPFYALVKETELNPADAVTNAMKIEKAALSDKAVQVHLRDSDNQAFAAFERQALEALARKETPIRDTMKHTWDYFVTHWAKSISNTPSGKKLGGDIATLRSNAEDSLASYKNRVLHAMRYETVSKKNQEHYTYLLDRPQSKWEAYFKKHKVPKDVQEKALQYAREVRELLDEVVPEGRKAGMTEINDATGEVSEWGFRDNYFPHKPDGEKVLAKSKKLLQYLFESGQLGLDDLNGIRPEKMSTQQAGIFAQLLILGSEGSEKRVGPQHKRQFNLPREFYRTDMAVITDYLETVIPRIERAKMFGAKDELAYAQVANIAKESALMNGASKAKSDAARAKQLLDTVFGRREYNELASAAVNNVNSFHVITKMPLSMFSQITQMFKPIMHTNLSSWAKGVGRFLFKRNTPSSQEMMTSAGGNLALVRKGIHENVVGAKSNFTKKYLDVILFNLTDQASRTVADFSGYQYVDFLARKLNKKLNYLDKKGIPYDSPKAEKILKKWKGRLEDRGVNANEVISRKFDKNLYLRDSEKSNFARNLEAETNYRGYQELMPEFAASLPGRIVTQFKSFQFNNTRLTIKHVKKELGRGNIMPIIYWATFCGVPGGVIANELRRLVSGIIAYAGTDEPIYKKSNVKKIIAPSKEDEKKIKDSVYYKVTGNVQNAHILEGLVEAYATSGSFLMFEQIYNFAKWGDPQFGPTAATITDAAVTTKKTIDRKNHKLRPIAEFAAGQLPVGYAVKERLRAGFKKDDEADKKKLDPRAEMRRALAKSRAPLRNMRRERKAMLRGYGHKKTKSAWDKWGL